MKHFIYKTTHKNGKYYVGRHSTTNIDDGYIGSGLWPRSLKNKDDVTREILEYASDTSELLDLERQYLLENVGKPNCMNIAIDPVGWTSNNHPMMNPDFVAAISGDNHWTRKDPDKAVKVIGKSQRTLVENGTHIFLGDRNPNKDGRNAKLAMERGTHVNLTEDNPSKQRSRNGTHQWFAKEDGTSTGGITNAKRVEEGTHNWLGPVENNRRIDAGTHNLLGDSSNKAMLAAGTHPSQVKKSCPHCGVTVSSGMYGRWHGDNCRHKT
jgi:hypothetical protein